MREGGAIVAVNEGEGKDVYVLKGKKEKGHTRSARRGEKKKNELGLLHFARTGGRKVKGGAGPGG